MGTTPRGAATLARYERDGHLVVKVQCDAGRHLTAGVVVVTWPDGRPDVPVLLRGHGFGAPLADLGGGPLPVRCRCGRRQLDVHLIAEALSAGQRVVRHADVLWGNPRHLPLVE
jgi:hypothetical protein